MPDILLILIVLFVVVLVIRGPKMLPRLGASFGGAVKQIRHQADKSFPEDDRPRVP